jgi:hypothetical protein
LALRLNPNDPETLADVGHYLAFMGEFERGVELSRRAQELNPLHPGWYHFSFARLDYSRKDYAGSIRSVEKIGLPHFYWTHFAGRSRQRSIGPPGCRQGIVEDTRGQTKLFSTPRIAKMERIPGGSRSHRRGPPKGWMECLTSPSGGQTPHKTALASKSLSCKSLVAGSLRLCGLEDANQALLDLFGCKRLPEVTGRTQPYSLAHTRCAAFSGNHHNRNVAPPGRGFQGLQ